MNGANRSILLMGNSARSDNQLIRATDFSRTVVMNRFYEAGVVPRAGYFHAMRYDPPRKSFFGLPKALQRLDASKLVLIAESRYLDDIERISDAVRSKSMEVCVILEDKMEIPYPDISPYPPYENRARKIPSTGFIMLNWLAKTYPIEPIHLIGFTFSGWQWHDWNHERQEVEKLVLREPHRVYLHKAGVSWSARKAP